MYLIVSCGYTNLIFHCFVCCEMIQFNLFKKATSSYTHKTQFIKDVYIRTKYTNISKIVLYCVLFTRTSTSSYSQDWILYSFIKTLKVKGEICKLKVMYIVMQLIFQGEFSDHIAGHYIQDSKYTSHPVDICVLIWFHLWTKLHKMNIQSNAEPILNSSSLKLFY